MTQIQENKLPEGWIETNLVSCLESLIDYRGKTPKKSDKGILTLSAKSVKMGKIDYSQAYYISPEEYKKFMVRGFPKKGDILMTTEAPLGCIAKLDRENISVAQRLLTLRGKKGVLDNDYLMYYLMSGKGQFELSSRASGSTVEGIKRSEFEKVNISLPPLPEQQSIAKILSSFDDKIELLREQNETLEKIGQELFKEWFGKYKVGNELPEGWRVGKLSDFGNIICGKTPSKDNKDFFGGDIPFIKIPDMHNEVYISETVDTLTELGANTQKNKFIPENSICVSCIATVGLVGITTKFSQTNQQINSIIPFESFYLEYLYFVLTNMKNDLIAMGGGGSATLNINTTSFSNIEINIPDIDLLKSFHEKVQNMFEKIKINSEEIQTLSKTRDELLPKLMKGEVRVV